MNDDRVLLAISSVVTLVLTALSVWLDGTTFAGLLAIVCLMSTFILPWVAGNVLSEGAPTEAFLLFFIPVAAHGTVFGYLIWGASGLSFAAVLVFIFWGSIGAHN